MLGFLLLYVFYLFTSRFKTEIGKLWREEKESKGGKEEVCRPREEEERQQGESFVFACSALAQLLRTLTVILLCICRMTFEKEEKKVVQRGTKRPNASK